MMNVTVTAMMMTVMRMIEIVAYVMSAPNVMNTIMIMTMMKMMIDIWANVMSAQNPIF